jgi:uncharacterized membrane protein YfcA
MELAPEVGFGVLFAVGFIAQVIDGALGMGYGITASAFLVSLGLPPAVTSATIHTVEIATTGVSSLSHAWFRNLNRGIFFSLLLPGVIGGVLGATLLARTPADLIRPFVWAYLLLTSVFVLARVLLNRKPLTVGKPGPALGGVAGFLDAVGGGGWGTITTSTMIARGIPPRYAIGTANAAEFFVTVAISATLWLHLETLRWDLIVALLLGGAVAAPLAAWITKHIPQRAAATAVGLVVFALGATGLVTSLT